MSSKLIKNFLFIFITSFIFFGCGSDNNSNTKYEVTRYEIKYEVIVQDSYDWNNIYGIKYNDNTNNNIWVGDSPDSPWTHEFITDEDDFNIYVSGRPMKCDGPCPDFTTSVTVKVYIDNVLYKSETDPDEAIISDSLDNLLSNGPE